MLSMARHLYHAVIGSAPVRSLLLLAAFVSWGCPGDRPCAYVDRGADAGALVTSACPPLACPDGATPASTGRCSCKAGLWPVLGACVDQDLGTRFCGKGAR